MESIVLISAIITKIIDALKGLKIASFWFPFIAMGLGILIYPLSSGSLTRLDVLHGIEAGLASMGLYEAAKTISGQKKAVDDTEKKP